MPLSEVSYCRCSDAKLELVQRLSHNPLIQENFVTTMPINRVFSGVQPTGNLHLRNYLGAIRKFVALQESHECIYCVVDLHAVTAELVQKDLKAQTREIAAAFIASGIDPEKHIVFNQSQVRQHAELA